MKSIFLVVLVIFAKQIFANNYGFTTPNGESCDAILKNEVDHYFSTPEAKRKAKYWKDRSELRLHITDIVPIPDFPLEKLGKYFGVVPSLKFGKNFHPTSIRPVKLPSQREAAYINERYPGKTLNFYSKVFKRGTGFLTDKRTLLKVSQKIRYQNVCILGDRLLQYKDFTIAHWAQDDQEALTNFAKENRVKGIYIGCNNANLNNGNCGKENLFARQGLKYELCVLESEADSRDSHRFTGGQYDLVSDHSYNGQNYRCTTGFEASAEVIEHQRILAKIQRGSAHLTAAIIGTIILWEAGVLAAAGKWIVSLIGNIVKSLNPFGWLGKTGLARYTHMLQATYLGVGATTTASCIAYEKFREKGELTEDELDELVAEMIREEKSYSEKVENGEIKLTFWGKIAKFLGNKWKSIARGADITSNFLIERVVPRNFHRMYNKKFLTVLFDIQLNSYGLLSPYAVAGNYNLEGVDLGEHGSDAGEEVQNTLRISSMRPMPDFKGKYTISEMYRVLKGMLNEERIPQIEGMGIQLRRLLPIEREAIASFKSGVDEKADEILEPVMRNFSNPDEDEMLIENTENATPDYTSELGEGFLDVTKKVGSTVERVYKWESCGIFEDAKEGILK